MATFTASEVRELAATIWPDLSGREEVAETLNAYADRLEADEKAVPVMVVNHVSSAEHDLPIGMKLYAHPSPSDAERLAEALRNLVSEWVAIADDGDATLEDSTIGYRACANRLSAMLAAHSAQAQPPAASVTDAMIMRAVEAWTSNGFGSPGRVFSIYSVAKAMLEAALAAQENPNG